MTDFLKLRSESFFHGNFNLLKNDFTLIVNNEVFQANKFLASFFAPAVSHLLSTDETLDSFVINTSSRGDFNILLTTFTNCQQEIKENDQEFLCEILTILGNEYLQIEFHANATKYHL